MVGSGLVLPPVNRDSMVVSTSYKPDLGCPGGVGVGVEVVSAGADGMDGAAVRVERVVASRGSSRDGKREGFSTSATMMRPSDTDSEDGGIDILCFRFSSI